MWSPVAAHPTAGGGRDRRGVLPAVGQDGAAGHCRRSTPPTGCWGSTSTPAAWPASPGAGGCASYNLPMGPPISAPGLMAMVGGMGLLAAVLRREKWLEPTIGRTSSRPDHLPNRRPGGAAAAPVVAAPAAAGHHPADDRALPRLRRLRRRRHLGRGHQEGRAGPAGAARPAAVLHRRRRSRRCGRSATSCWPRTPSRGSRSPRWSTTKLAAGKLDGYQYADMPDDRDTWRLVLAGLDHTARRAYRCALRRLHAEHQENDRRRVRRRAGWSAARGTSSTSRGPGRW